MKEETKKRISLALRGRKKSALHRRHISEGLRGKEKSKAHKKAISEGVKRNILQNKASKFRIL